MAGRNIKTQAIVLRRTNYGEADRILKILTPEGKMSVMAKGVRKEKSKLAGGVEMFSLSEVVLLQGKSEMLTLTSAKAVEFYQNLLTNLDALEVAAEILKKVSKAAEMVDNPGFFKLTVQTLRALNKKKDKSVLLTYFYFNLAALLGEQINLYTDITGEKLKQGQTYAWESIEKALRPTTAGKISENEIKVMRLMLSAELSLVLKVTGIDKMVEELLFIAKSLNQM